ncbi:hypothetical protein D3C78_1573980 [compost metagenome]
MADSHGVRPRATASNTLIASRVSACCSTTARVCAMVRRDRVLRFWPLRWMFPRLGLRTPASSLSSVDFPEPLGPTRPRVSPGWMSR